MTQIKNNIAVISDIHANADALNYVLRELKNKDIGLFVILGDLLTYGCQPNEVLSTLASLNRNNNCVFIKGNHDQIYLDQRIGLESKDYALQGFVEESVEWTVSEIADVNLYTQFDWQESFSIDSIYFAHANPGVYGDWRYVESVEQCKEAADILRDKKYKVGIFGHTHRRFAAECSEYGIVKSFLGNTYTFDAQSVLLLNPGSVGQPRGKGFGFMILELMENSIKYELVEFKVDIFNSMQMINQTEISTETKERLISYLWS
jgi:predicted phosphodiesterase